MNHNPTINEVTVSQIPTLVALINMGYEYLPPHKIMKLRGNNSTNVVLEDILRERLHEINRIDHKGKKHRFTDEAIETAIKRLQKVKHAYRQKNNEEIYNYLTIGTSIEQNIDGDRKSHNLHFIDWHNIKNNVFHVTAEFPVQRSGVYATARPDIVLFINGIPVVVIECKAPDIPVDEAISQLLKYQRENYIPRLFAFSQLLIATNKNDVRYATAGTEKAFWSVWKEQEDEKKDIEKVIYKKLNDKAKDDLFSEPFSEYRDDFERIGNRSLTEQDKILYSLCRPERLLELIRKFIVFDNGEKKITRYQQFFVVRSTINRIKQLQDNKRPGGVIWHTQGSGKSLTMIMLAQALAMDREIANPRIVLVTDRIDLDKQLGKTFLACGLEKKTARSGKELMACLQGSDAIITTLVHRFGKDESIRDYQNTDKNIFVLVDESHRTQYGEAQGHMRNMMPNACYIGFTGTPLFKKDKKNTFKKFGRMIQPTYPIQQAIKDKAVVPLLYEARYTERELNEDAIDKWFERRTRDLTDNQKADLKKKYSRANAINSAEPVISAQAFDISEHYRKHWKGLGFKAQLVARSKADAIKYHEALKSIGDVSSAVVISAPGKAENEEIDEDPNEPTVQNFWDKMMNKYGSEKNYLTNIINNFKQKEEEPEILIVVDKLLTGFDAPINTVLYLCRTLKDHTLLQAIARVNRVCDGKEFGYIIDYNGILEELDKAITDYKELANFEEKDILGTFIPIDEETARLADRYHAIKDIFKGVKEDNEEYEKWLVDDERRDEFAEAVAKYARCLGIALSSEKFIKNTTNEKIKEYKEGLKYFDKLKRSVMLRYNDIIDYGEYEKKIQKLLDDHIYAPGEVIKSNEPVDIFNAKELAKLKGGTGDHKEKSPASRADEIAHATKKVIEEKMDLDPSFYQKFSKMLDETMQDFRDNRIFDIDYLNKVTEIADAVSGGRSEDDKLPEEIRKNDAAAPYYGVIAKQLDNYESSNPKAQQASIELALRAEKIIQESWKVDFHQDPDAQNKIRNDIEDYFYDIIREDFIPEVTEAHISEITDEIINIAKSHSRAKT